MKDLTFQKEMSSLKIINFLIQSTKEKDFQGLSIWCGGGTYIRSFIRNIGMSLYAVAVMTHLVCTRQGSFGLKILWQCQGVNRMLIESTQHFQRITMNQTRIFVAIVIWSMFNIDTTFSLWNNSTMSFSSCTWMMWNGISASIPFVCLDDTAEPIYKMLEFSVKPILEYRWSWTSNENQDGDRFN